MRQDRVKRKQRRRLLLCSCGSGKFRTAAAAASFMPDAMFRCRCCNKAENKCFS